MQEFVELLDELIAVETDEGLIANTYADGNKIKVILCNNNLFTITVEQN